ncbi:MAG: hypothetical protein PHU66_09265 [Bacteroidaceae bacterium]|nr:hypothetical protein [Bacteroidaceae bacterium]
MLRIAGTLSVKYSLSSGIIRYFLELCEKAFDFAIMNGFDWSDIRPITPREQTRAARYVSRYKINNIIQYEPYGRELRLFVQNFGEICSSIHNNPNSTLGEPEPNHFSTDYFKLDSASNKILLAGVYWAILQERESSKDKDSMPVEFYDYHLNHIYCPYFGISYRKKHKIELSSTLVMDLLSGDDQKAKQAAISFLNKLKPSQQGSLFGGEYSDD